jgi:LysM repeat protein
MRRILLNSMSIFALLLAALAIPQRAVHAVSSISTGDLIATVNSIRTGNGLPALVESQTLDNCSQWTADTMANINATNHLAFMGYPDASTRCANMGFGGGNQVFVTENWAMAGSISLSDLFNSTQYWNDTEHYYPMTKSQYTYIGAGEARASNGETYYIVQAGDITGETAATSAGSSSSSSSSYITDTPDTSQYMPPVVISTPGADGMIRYTVLPGQTESQIAYAYGISLTYLMQENNLTSDYLAAGAILTIKQAPTATITPTPTSTPVYPTRTPSLVQATYTPMSSPTATPTPASALPTLDRPTFGLILVIVSVLGLAAIVFFNFFKPGKPVAEPAPAKAPEVKKAEPPEAQPEAVKKKRTPKKKTAE